MLRPGFLLQLLDFGRVGGLASGLRCGDLPSDIAGNQIVFLADLVDRVDGENPADHDADRERNQQPIHAAAQRRAGILRGIGLRNIKRAFGGAERGVHQQAAAGRRIAAGRFAAG